MENTVAENIQRLMRRNFLKINLTAILRDIFPNESEFITRWEEGHKFQFGTNPVVQLKVFNQQYNLISYIQFVTKPDITECEFYLHTEVPKTFTFTYDDTMDIEKVTMDIIKCVNSLKNTTNEF